VIWEKTIRLGFSAALSASAGRLRLARRSRLARARLSRLIRLKLLDGLLQLLYPILVIVNGDSRGEGRLLLGLCGGNLRRGLRLNLLHDGGDDARPLADIARDLAGLSGERRGGNRGPLVNSRNNILELRKESHDPNLRSD
jgi:hypothetical protein